MNFLDSEVKASIMFRNEYNTIHDKIDWKLIKKSIIRRVFSYVNEVEKGGIIRFMGEVKLIAYCQL